MAALAMNSILILSCPSRHSSLKRRRCRLPLWPLHGVWHMKNGLRFCPTYLRDDVARGRGLAHRSVPGWCAREHHTWQDPEINPLLALDELEYAGALTTLIVLAVIVVTIVIIPNQVRVIQKTGWSPHYIGWCVAGGLVLVAPASLLMLTSRLHPYIVALTHCVSHEVVHDSLSVSVGTSTKWRGGSRVGFNLGGRMRFETGLGTRIIL